MEVAGGGTFDTWSTSGWWSGGHPSSLRPLQALAVGLGFLQAPAPLSPVSSNSVPKPREGDQPETQRASWPGRFSRRPGSVGALSCHHLFSYGLASSHCLLCKVSSPLLPFKNIFIFLLHWESCPRDPKYLSFVYLFPASGALLEILAAYTTKTLVLDLVGCFCFVFLLTGNSCFRKLSIWIASSLAISM